MMDACRIGSGRFVLGISDDIPSGGPALLARRNGSCSSLAPFMAAMLRDRSLPRSPVDGMDHMPEPGLLVLSETLDILSYNASARQWMSFSPGCRGYGCRFTPRPLRAVCFRALSESSRGTAYSTGAHTRVRLSDSSFASIRACLLHGPDSLAKLAVTLEPQRICCRLSRMRWD